MIPVRLDSIERIENLIVVVKYIKCHFQTIIQVLADSTYNNDLIKTYPGDRIHYRFVEDFDPNFQRTKYIGMENEHFFGWGRVDGERVTRAKILVMNFNVLKVPCFI